ncbi:hypothetical protein K7W42_07620 [Deinococcus sp. HMF7604]|uniref:hypothetical protein n=1 Tax=Deinococcus betulae TaxID=2873312 RepID=UPI001CCC288A|nr:hypothetical protein [Deinococcus betulae]MBZ9750727.1 hypothetical protein [Deinococcus betulae]
MHTTTPALTRTWATETHCRAHGEDWGTVQATVTLTRTPAGIEATVNGQPADLADALRILRGADTVTVTAQTLAPAPLGKPRAAKLHRLMACAGVPSGQHCGFAETALERPVSSLAALTEREARQVWGYLRATFPSLAA